MYCTDAHASTHTRACEHAHARANVLQCARTKNVRKQEGVGRHAKDRGGKMEGCIVT